MLDFDVSYDEFVAQKCHVECVGISVTVEHCGLLRIREFSFSARTTGEVEV